MKTYKDVYQMPLEQRHGWVYDQKDNFVFEFLFHNTETENKILRVINGYENFKNKRLKFHHENGVIKDNRRQDVILIRGWGFLTGTGGLNLSDEEALNIQNTFANFIVERLNYREV